MRIHEIQFATEVNATSNRKTNHGNFNRHDKGQHIDSGSNVSKPRNDQRECSEEREQNKQIQYRDLVVGLGDQQSLRVKLVRQF